MVAYIFITYSLSVYMLLNESMIMYHNEVMCMSNEVIRLHVCLTNVLVI